MITGETQVMIPERKYAEKLFIDFCDGYKNRDLSTLQSLFTNKINMWGTGPDEHRVGLEQVKVQLKRDFSQSEKSEIEVVAFVPTPIDALWAAALCNGKITINGKTHCFENLRGTIIIEKEDGIWKISHMHASFPDYRNAENSSFPVVS